MKITLVHGDNSLQISRRLKILSPQEITLNGKLNFKEVLSSQNLFKTDNNYALKLNQDFTSADINWLKNNRQKYDLSLIVYKEGLFSAAFINKMKVLAKVERYDLPQTVFKFLDSFFPGNKNNCWLLFQAVKQTEEPIFVMNLLASQLKYLFLIKELPEQLTFPPWRLAKLKKQAGYFSSQQIKAMIAYLAQLDIKSKSSDSNLFDSLDLLILRQLE